MRIQLLTRTIIALLFVLVVGTPLFYYPWGVYPYTLAKQEFFQAILEVAGFLWLVLISYAPKYRPRWTPLAIIGAVFLGLLLIVSFAGVDWWRSLWSTYERGVGVIAFFHLALLALIVSSLYEEIPWRRLFAASLFTSIVTIVIALIQLRIPIFLLNESSTDRPGATFGNPTFLAGYLLFSIFLAVYFILDLLRDSKRELSGTERILVAFGFLALGVDIAGIFLGQTRGDILALAAGFMVLLGIFSFRPPQVSIAFLRSRWLYAGCLITIVFVVAIFALTFQSKFWTHVPGVPRFRDLLTSFSVTNHTIAARVYVLHAAWQGFLDRPWLGWGPENFTTVSSKYYDPHQLELGYVETRFDEPHNFLLGYLVSGGVPSLLAFLGLLGVAIFEAFRNRDNLLIAAFCSALVAYVVGESFAFDTIGSVMMLYFFFGFIDGGFHYGHGAQGEAKKSAHEKERIHMPQWAFVVAFASGCIFAYIVNVSSVVASYYQYEGFTDFLHQNIPAGLRDFNSALAPWSPYNWNFVRDSSDAILGQYFNYPGTVSDADALAALMKAEHVRDEHPFDSYNHYSLINFYNEVSHIDPQKYLPLAEQEAKVALALSPNRQEIYFLLAKTKTFEKDYPGALVTLKTALDLDPDVADAHFYYGIVAFAMGDMTAEYNISEMKIGYDEFEQAMRMNRQWKTFYEPRTIADDLADYYEATHDKQYLVQSIDLYKIALTMSPGDLESTLKLGIAYYEEGDSFNARKYLMEAAAATDLTKLSRYSEIRPMLTDLGIVLHSP